MAYVNVEVDLDEFSAHEIICELESRRIISRVEKDKLIARKEPVGKEENGFASDQDWIAEARWRAQRGEIGECVIMLARAYPEFDALAKRVQ
jgi:hypothetical protein